MKKNFTANNKLLWIAALLVIVFSAKSCRKDQAPELDKPTSKDVQWAKSYYESKLQPNQSSLLSPNKMMSNGLASGKSRTNKISIRWNEGYSSKTPNYDFVEVPMNMDGRIIPTIITTKNPDVRPVLDQDVVNASLTRLVIYKDDAGITNQRIITYVPDKDYLNRAKGNISKNRIDKLDKDFFGYLEYKDWNGKVLWILRIENGKSVRKIDMAGAMSQADAVKLSGSRSSGGQGKMMRYEVVNCGEWTLIYSWQQWCYYEGQSQTPYSCDPPEVYNSQLIPNCPLGGGPPTSVDCTDPANFDNGKCQPANMVPIDTANKVDKPCLVDALTKALGKGAKSKIKNLMDSTFLVNSSVNLTFYSLPVPSTSPNAEAIAYARQSGNNPLEQMIVFNENKTGHRSQEFLVATIYHEMLHAYLGTLVTKDANGKFIVTNQHEQMVTNYLNMMKQDLRSIYPGMSEPDALGLAWGGLEATSRYDQLTYTEKYNISQINIKYSTKPGPGVTNSAGTYCN